MGQLLKEIAEDLNDLDQSGIHTAWSEEKLLADINDAVALISTLLPDAVPTEVAIVELEPCSERQNILDGQRIVAVIGQVDGKHGRVIKRLIQTGNTSATAWTGRTCTPARGMLQSYSIDYLGGLSVHPEPTAGIPTFVKVSYIKRIDKDTEVPAVLSPIIKEWVLYKCLQVDADAGDAQLAIANSHSTRFFQLIGSVRQSMLESRNG